MPVPNILKPSTALVPVQRTIEHLSAPPAPRRPCDSTLAIYVDAYVTNGVRIMAEMDQALGIDAIGVQVLRQRASPKRELESMACLLLHVCGCSIGAMVACALGASVASFDTVAWGYFAVLRVLAWRPAPHSVDIELSPSKTAARNWARSMHANPSRQSTTKLAFFASLMGSYKAPEISPFVLQLCRKKDLSKKDNSLRHMQLAQSLQQFVRKQKLFVTKPPTSGNHHSKVILNQCAAPFWSPLRINKKTEPSFSSGPFDVGTSGLLQYISKTDTAIAFGRFRYMPANLWHMAGHSVLALHKGAHSWALALHIDDKAQSGTGPATPVLEVASMPRWQLGAYVAEQMYPFVRAQQKWSNQWSVDLDVYALAGVELNEAPAMPMAAPKKKIAEPLPNLFVPTYKERKTVRFAPMPEVLDEISVC